MHLLNFSASVYAENLKHQLISQYVALMLTPYASRRDLLFCPLMKLETQCREMISHPSIGYHLHLNYIM